jgi:hypothetical protein
MLPTSIFYGIFTLMFLFVPAIFLLDIKVGHSTKDDPSSGTIVHYTEPAKLDKVPGVGLALAPGSGSGLGLDEISENGRREKLMTLSPLKLNTLLGTQKSRFAYITLLHGIDNTFSYRGFLYNALITKKSLSALGSTADFIVMIGFTTLG